MGQETNEGTNYLLALKGGAISAASTAVAPREGGTASTAVAPAKSATPQPFTGIEKRRTPRYKCEGSAELCEEGSDVRTWATFKDISIHGCYVEIAGGYPVGALLRVKLEANGFQVNAQGCVRVSYPGLGLGIAFQHMSEEDRGRLKDLVRTVARPVIVGGPRLESALRSEIAKEAMPTISDAVPAVQSLMRHFENREEMTRNEFIKLLKKSQGA